MLHVRFRGTVLPVLARTFAGVLRPAWIAGRLLVGAGYFFQG